MTPKTIKLTILAALSVLMVAVVPASALASRGDRNRDRIPDRWEKRHGLSLKVDQRKRDQDRDGLRNLAEFRSGTSPRAVDTDKDGVDDTDEDRDNDRVDNGNEQREGTLPNDRDSDNDRKNDAAEDRDRDGLNNAGEDASGNDPVDQDSDNDATTDGAENAGTVLSFDPATGALVILRADGTEVSGTVDGSTAIYCEDEDGHEQLNESDDRSATRSSDRASVRDDSTEGDEEDDGSSEDNSGDDDSGDDGSEDGEDGLDNNACAAGVSLLAPGARIHEASLDTGTGIFLVVEIVSPDSADDQEVEEAVGQIKSFDGTTLTILYNDGSETSATVNGSTEVECKGLYDEEEDDENCGPSDLVPGTVVHEVEIETGVVDKIELLR